MWVLVRGEMSGVSLSTRETVVRTGRNFEKERGIRVPDVVWDGLKQ